MSETKNLLDYDTAAILLLRAMLWDKKSISEYLPVGENGGIDPKVTVELKVNGKEVDFTPFVNEMVKTNNETIEKRVAEELSYYTQFDKLRNFVHKLDDIECEIEEAIETMIGKKLPWREPEYS